MQKAFTLSTVYEWSAPSTPPLTPYLSPHSLVAQNHLLPRSLVAQKAFRERTLQTVYEWSAPSTSMDEAGGSNGEAREAGTTEPPPTLEPLVEGQFAAMTLDDIVNRCAQCGGMGRGKA